MQPVYVGESDESPIGPCVKCGCDDFDEDLKKKYVEVVSLTKDKLEEMKSENYLDVAKFLLKHQGNLLHKLNLWKVKTLDAAFESAIDLTVWEEAVGFGTQNLDGLR